MSAGVIQVQQSTIRDYTRQLHLPTVGGQFLKLAEEAIQQKQGHVAFLEPVSSWFPETRKNVLSAVSM